MDIDGENVKQGTESFETNVRKLIAGREHGIENATS
jgi:hypothetical protein